MRVSVFVTNTYRVDAPPGEAIVVIRDGSLSDDELQIYIPGKPAVVAAIADRIAEAFTSVRDRAAREAFEDGEVVFSRARTRPTLLERATVSVAAEDPEEAAERDRELADRRAAYAGDTQRTHFVNDGCPGGHLSDGDHFAGMP